MSCPFTLPMLSRGIRLQIIDPVDRHAPLGSDHLQARHVGPIEPARPLPWRIVETSDRGLPVFTR